MPHGHNNGFYVSVWLLAPRSGEKSRARHHESQIVTGRGKNNAHKCRKVSRILTTFRPNLQKEPKAVEAASSTEILTHRRDSLGHHQRIKSSIWRGGHKAKPRLQHSPLKWLQSTEEKEEEEEEQKVRRSISRSLGEKKG